MPDAFAQAVVISALKRLVRLPVRALMDVWDIAFPNRDGFQRTLNDVLRNHGADLSPLAKQTRTYAGVRKNPKKKPRACYRPGGSISHSYWMWLLHPHRRGAVIAIHAAAVVRRPGEVGVALDGRSIFQKTLVHVDDVAAFVGVVFQDRPRQRILLLAHP